MVYRDESRHLVADSLGELHEFAARAGIKRCWFDADSRSKTGRKPHYDIPKRLRESNFLREAQLVDSRKILEVSRRLGMDADDLMSDSRREWPPDDKNLRWGWGPSSAS